MRRTARWLIALAAVVVLLGALLRWLNLRDEPPLGPHPGAPATAEQVARGAYLARAGNCMHCHTERGGAAYAGGRAIDTPFGTIHSSNLTPDPANGIGRWSPAEFYRAMHNGRSRDGRLLYPAFPYPDFTIVTRADSDALFAYLQSLPPVARPAKAHALRWPYSSQVALAVWRALYFRPATFTPDPARPANWNRGAYLVRGLGHCTTCHGARDALGGLREAADLSGASIAVDGWMAPALDSPRAAGVADWSAADIVDLLKSGVASHGLVAGPMAEVVQYGTQYLAADDLDAIASYLKTLPQAPAPSVPLSPSARTAPASVRAIGAKLYEHHCAQCHGLDGKGHAVPGASAYAAYPPLAGNRAVLLPDPANLVQSVLYGGFAPATPGNPRPFGMPPFVLTLSNAEIAAVLTHIRTAWGNTAGYVTEFDVSQARPVRRD